MKFNIYPSRFAMAAALIGNIIFGFSFLFTRLALNCASPYVLLSCRFLLALFLLSLCIPLFQIRISLRGKPWKTLLLLGIFEPILYFIGESYGVLYTSVTFSAIMIALIPIVSFWFSALFLKEKATLRQVFFCILSIAGVILMSIHGQQGANQLKGFILLLIAVLSSVVFNLLSRKLSVTFTPFERTYVMFFDGFLFFGIIALVENHSHMENFFLAFQQPNFVWALLYLSVFSSVVAFFLINFANTYLPVTRVIVFCNIITLVSVFAGVVFLHEAFSYLSFVAAAMIVIGVCGVQTPEKKPVPAPE